MDGWIYGQIYPEVERKAIERKIVSGVRSHES